MIIITKIEGEKFRLMNMCAFESFIQPYVNFFDSKILIYHEAKSILTIHFDSLEVKKQWEIALTNALDEWISQKNRIVHASKSGLTEMPTSSGRLKNSKISFSSMPSVNLVDTSSIEAKVNDLPNSQRPRSSYGVISQSAPFKNIHNNDTTSKNLSEFFLEKKIHEGAEGSINEENKIQTYVKQDNNQGSRKKIIKTNIQPGNKPLPYLNISSGSNKVEYNNETPENNRCTAKECQTSNMLNSEKDSLDMIYEGQFNSPLEDFEGLLSILEANVSANLEKQPQLDSESDLYYYSSENKTLKESKLLEKGAPNTINTKDLDLFIKELEETNGEKTDQESENGN